MKLKNMSIKLNETLSISNTLLEEMKKLTMSYALNNKFIQFAYRPDLQWPTITM